MRVFIYFIVLIVIAACVFLAIWIAVNITSEIKIRARIKSQYDAATTLKKAQDQDYEKLLEKQEVNSKNKQIAEEKVEIDYLVGEKKVSIIFVYPRSASISRFAELTNILMDSRKEKFDYCTVNSCIPAISINYIPTYLNSQSQKYGPKMLDLKVRAFGPYYVDGLSAIGDMKNYWGKDEFGILKLQDDFIKNARANNISIEPKVKTIFLYFDDSISGSDSDRFYDTKKFRSFASQERGLAYVNVYNFSPKFSPVAVEILLHELLHLFNASDKYYEDDSEGKICSKNGLGELNLGNKIVKQTKADIMCGYIENYGEKPIKGSLINENLTINSITAKEINWIKN